MKTADLLKKIEALEARIRELESRSVYVPYAAPHTQPWQGTWPYGPTYFTPGTCDPMPNTLRPWCGTLPQNHC